MALTLASDAITFTDSTSLSSGIISTEQLANGAVTADKLASNAVSTQTISNSAITAEKMSGGQSGDAPVYGCRAWVNFDGQRNEADDGASTNGANVKIRASGNVARVVKEGVGIFTVVFATDMPDANYCVQTTAGDSSTEVAMWVNNLSLSSVRVNNGINAAYSNNDPTFGFVTIFR